jgi:hypothetical protein
MGAGYLLPFEGAGKGGERLVVTRLDVLPKQGRQRRQFWRIMFALRSKQTFAHVDRYNCC